MDKQKNNSTRTRLQEVLRDVEDTTNAELNNLQNQFETERLMLENETQNLTQSIFKSHLVESLVQKLESPSFDLELGLGWGSYFWGNRYHFDIQAGYDFQVFFSRTSFNIQLKMPFFRLLQCMYQLK